MAFPIFTPSFFKELVDVTKPVEEYSDLAGIIVSPAAVEYVLYLSNPDVVRRLMAENEPLSFKMSRITGEEEAMFAKRSSEAVAVNPSAEYYWQLRTLMMVVLQNREVTFEKRMLLLNYAIKTVQGMIDSHQPNLIPEFVNKFGENKDYDKVLEYFKGISPHPEYSLADGVSLLKSVVKSSPEYKEVLGAIYKNLGVSGPETLNMVDMKSYVEKRRKFSEVFMAEHSNWIENIMINYVWTYSLPYACSDKLGIWDNYVFFCVLYNAYKVLFTCYMDGRGEEDFVKAVSAFDGALRKSGRDIVWKMVAAVKNAGQDNNGDMAILVLS
ncbi:MAG: hypothetical protein LUI05_08305 [Oscillospiraceae bacterium]|nr:hypothetical protein [Oscillospiraceae bacterium]